MLTLRYILPTVVIIYDNYDCSKCGLKQYERRVLHWLCVHVKRFIRRGEYIKRGRVCNNVKEIRKEFDFYF